MEQNIYINFNAEKSKADRNGEQTGRKCRKKAEQIAMEENIYENMAASQGADHKMKPKVVGRHRQPQSQKEGGAVTVRVLYGLIAVCVFLLFLLLAAVAVLSVMFSNLTASNNQLQASYVNLSRERDDLIVETAQLQTSYGELIMVRDQLQNSNYQLTAQRDQLLNINNQLNAHRGQLQSINNQLTAQRDQLQSINNQLKAQRDQLQATCGMMGIHLDQLQNIDSNLTMGGDHLLMMSWNMAMESDQFKQDDDTMTIETEQLPRECSSLAGELGRLRTGYSNLALEKDLIQEEKDLLQRGLAQLGWKYFNSSFYHLTAERKSWNESRRECEDRSSDLVIVNSQEEWEFLCKNYPNASAWIGLSDTEGQWEWVDGQPLSAGLWQVSEPRNDTSVEQCATTLPETTAWAYGRCDGTAFGICEKAVGSM